MKYYLKLRPVFLVLILVAFEQPTFSAIIDANVSTEERENIFSHSTKDQQILSNIDKINKRINDSEVTENSDVYILINNPQHELEKHTKTANSSLQSKFNRYQWESALNTFPVIPLGGYTASDPTSYFILHNASAFFNFVIAIIPITFTLLFLGVGSLLDIQDIPLLNYIIEEYF